MATTTNPDPCVLKPGETCAFCNYTRPLKKPAKARLACHECGEPFAKGERRRLLRGKWVHVGKEGLRAMMSGVIGAFIDFEPTARDRAMATGFVTFRALCGVGGLAKEDEEKATIDILAVHADRPGKGQFRAFIKALQGSYEEIRFWHDLALTDHFSAALQRYGFKPWAVVVDLESVNGWELEAPVTPDQAIAKLIRVQGDMAAKLAALVATLPLVEVHVTYRPPTCVCGTVLGLWVGRHTGLAFIYHPPAMRPCARAGHRAQGPTPGEAMAAYMLTAADLGLDLPPPDAPPDAPPEDDPFADEFTI